MICDLVLHVGADAIHASHVCYFGFEECVGHNCMAVDADILLEPFVSKRFNSLKGFSEDLFF